MTQLRLTIDCDNEAFTGDWGGDEIARILRDLADKIPREMPECITDHDTWVLRDINGNTVGKAVLE